MGGLEKDAWIAVDKVVAPAVGGSTRCNHSGCNCRIKNEDYEDFKSTNKKCTIFKHSYYDHDIFAWALLKEIFIIK